MQVQTISIDQLKILVAAAVQERQSRLAFTVPQLMDAFGISRTTVYEEIGSGRLASYQVGRRRYVSASAAAEWQKRLEAETAAKTPQPAAVA